jgi:predicted MFS family arabinose efflux permease
MSAYAAAAFVVRIVLSRLIRGWGETRLLSRSFWLGAASFAVLPLFSHPVALGAVAFLFGLGMGCGQPLTMMLAFSHSAAGRSGEALGLRLTANHLTRVVGPLVFGSIGSALGLGAVFWVNGLLLASGAWLTRREADSALPDR